MRTRKEGLDIGAIVFNWIITATGRAMVLVIHSKPKPNRKVQEPSTAFIDRMPRAAIAATNVDYILPLTDIARLLNQLAGSEHG